MRPTRAHRFLTSRIGIIIAAVTGFGVGAAGFAAAQQNDAPPEVAPAVTADAPPANNEVLTTIDDDGPTTTIGGGLPAPFTTSHSSTGGSINLTWSGTAFTSNSVSPAPGFRTEVKHQSRDWVRIDFDGAGFRSPTRPPGYANFAESGERY